MEVTGKTGLIIAAVAGGAALLLGSKKKKPAVAQCPPGSKLDVSSGKCIYIQTTEVQVGASSGDQKNRGGDGDAGAQASYTYNMQARAQWKKEAENYANDATIKEQYLGIMRLIEAIKDYDDSPKGRAAVDRVNGQIADLFADIKDTRARIAKKEAEIKFNDGRNALATQYEAAASAAAAKFGEISDTLRVTFERTKDCIDSYNDRQSDIARAAADMRRYYGQVVAAMQVEGSNGDIVKLPHEVKAALPPLGSFGTIANVFAKIGPQPAAVDTVLINAPLVQKQLAALEVNFRLNNQWGLAAAQLRNVANPLSAAAIEINRQAALKLGKGSLYCGRVAAVLTALPVLIKVETLLNQLEISARVYEAGLTLIHKWVDYAYETQVTWDKRGDEGDPPGVTYWMDAMFRRLNAGPCAQHPGGDRADGGTSDNSSHLYIQKQTSWWLKNSCFSMYYQDKGAFLPTDELRAAAATIQSGGWVPPTMDRLFHAVGAPGEPTSWGMPDDTLAQLDAIFATFKTWLSGSGILILDTGAPNTDEFKQWFDLSLVGFCPYLEPTAKLEPLSYYANLQAGPIESLAGAPTANDNDPARVVEAQSFKNEALRAFNGLRGLRGSRVTVREGAGRGGVVVRESRGGLGGLGGGHGLGDPIQSILSSLI